ncbi:Proton-coupled folate transporter [Folsomia candida]|uniref:Proton-coupled folate transporter n=1 Tax=Folsomia candida TaxID=158441 RepID=A0A226E3L4_FOLCA|nr:Proton-coupled folate transporter [Folsomia candida]
MFSPPAEKDKAADQMVSSPPPEVEQQHRVKAKVREWVGVLSSVSVEPAALCMMASNLMTYLLFQNLFIENICRVGRNHSEEVCREIVSVNPAYAEEEQEIQKIFAYHKSYRVLLDFTLPIIFVLFVGPWSDYYGRKIPLLVTSTGTALYAMVSLYCSFHVGTMDPLWVNLITAIPRCLTGGEVAFGMAAYSYISDKTDHKYRTVRTGMLNAGYQLGVPLGFSLVGLAARSGLSYSTSFSISVVFSLSAVVIVALTVKNETKFDRMRNSGSGIVSKKRESGESNPTCWSIIDPRNNIISVIALPFKRREGNARMNILLLLLAFIFSAAPIHGEFQVFYLFVRERLGWDVVAFGSFSSFNWFIGVSGVALSMGILSKWMQLRDPIVGFISGMSQMASTVDLMNGTMVVIARSMLSKLVHRDEIGKLFSLIAVLESFIPLGIIPVYATVYGLTVQTFSGSVIILSAILTIPPQIIYMWFICNKKGHEQEAIGQEGNNRLGHKVSKNGKFGESGA